MTVEFWYGVQSQHRTEQDLFSDLYVYLGQQSDRYWMLSNFQVRGAWINLAVLKNSGVFLAELKHIWSPVQGGRSGPWRFERPDGGFKDFRNPYAMVVDSLRCWREWMTEPTAAGALDGVRFAGLHVPQTYVVIAPDIAPGSRVPQHIDDVYVRGLSNFKADLVLHRQPGPELTRNEIVTLIGQLGLARADAGTTTTDWHIEPVPLPAVSQLAPLGGPAGGEVFRLTKARIRVGREEDNDLVLRDGRVSGHHAILRFQDEGWWTVEDVGSRNGTFLQVGGEAGAERRVSQAQTLQDGVVLRFGPCYFRVMLSSPRRTEPVDQMAFP